MDTETSETICGSCGKVTATQNERGFLKPEKLGSIPDPNYRETKSNGEVFGLMKRVAKLQHEDGPNEKWNTLTRDLASKIGVPEYVEDSVIHYHVLHRHSMKRIQRREAISALLFVFSKNYLNNNLSLKALCETVSADPAKAGKYLRHFILDDGLVLNYRPAEEYARVHGARLNMSHGVVERSLEFILRYREFSPLSANPRTIGASALYLACRENGHRYTQKELANAFGIAEYTVRENCANVRKCLEGIESPR